MRAWCARHQQETLSLINIHFIFLKFQAEIIVYKVTLCSSFIFKQVAAYFMETQYNTVG